MKREHFIDAAVCALLMVISAALYRKIVRLWWMFDDPFHLNILKNAPVWSLLSQHHLFPRGLPAFTPLFVYSLKSDLSIFGLDAKPFYVHQLIAFALLSAFYYLLLRLWCSSVAAAGATLVMMVGFPVQNTIPLLMLRHYIEGAMLAVAATLLFVFAVRRDRTFSIASGVLYFLAACSKEIFVPLPILFLSIPEDTLRKRARLLTPHVIAATTYAAWRIMSLGLDVQPYGFVVPPEQRYQVLAALPIRLVERFAGPYETGYVLIASVILSVVILLLRSPGSRLPIAVALIVSTLPIIPVATQVQPRWSFALWLFAAGSIAFLPRAVSMYGAAFALAAVVAAFAAYRAEWPSVYRQFQRMSDEARVVAALGKDEIVLNPITPAVTMLELEKLTSTPARAFYDELPLCDPNFSLHRIFEYDPARREILETNRQSILRSCDSIRTRPLQIRISFDRRGSLYWAAGPYRDGRWTFILWDGLVAYDVPSVGGFHSEGLEHFNLRLRYISPLGWRTYSPMLELDSRKGPIAFRR